MAETTNPHQPHGHDDDPDVNPGVSYEPRDVNVFQISAFGIGLLLACIVTVFAMWIMFDFLFKREDAKNAGVPVLFLYIPIKGLHPFPALLNYMRRTGANYIDLTEQRPRPPVGIYLRHDNHLSAEGHRYVADLVERWIPSHLPAIARARSEGHDGGSAK